MHGSLRTPSTASPRSWEYLSGPYRQEIVDRIAQARDEGDLRENGGYHAARDEQAKNEARIKQLKHLLETAHIGDTPADDGVVEHGMVIEAEVAGRTLKFLLGSREIEDTLPAGSDLRSSPRSRRWVPQSWALSRATRSPTPLRTVRN